MPRMMIRLKPAEMDALSRIAVAERRDTRDQAAVAIAAYLEQRQPSETKGGEVK